MKQLLILLSIFFPITILSQNIDRYDAFKYAGTGGIGLHSGSTAQRPIGDIRWWRWNTDSNRIEIKTNSSVWKGLLFNGEISGNSGWSLTGNTVGTTGILGTLDNNHVDFYSNNTQRARLTNGGLFLIGSTTAIGGFSTTPLQVTGQSYFSGKIFIGQTPSSGNYELNLTGNLNATGTASQIGNIQLGNNGTASGTGTGLFTNNSTSFFSIQSNVGTDKTPLKLEYYSGLTRPMGGAITYQRNVMIAMGYGVVAANNSIGNILSIEPTYNQTASFTGTTYRDVYINAAETSLTGAIHFSIMQLKGSNLLNTVNGNTGIGLSDTTAIPGAKLHVNGTVRLDGMLAGDPVSPILVKDADSVIRQVSQASLTGVSNIYNNDGTLAANRTITGNGKQLTFNNVLIYNMNVGGIRLSSATQGMRYEQLVSTIDSTYQFGPIKSGVRVASYVVDTFANFNVGGSALSASSPLYTTGGNLFAGNGFMSGGGNFYHVNTFTTGTVSVLPTYYFIVADATSGNITFNLPAASTVFGTGMGIQYVFKRIDNTGNTVTVQVNATPGTDTIDGASSFTLVGQWSIKKIQCISTSAFAINN